MARKGHGNRMGMQPIYFAEDALYWRKLMRENKWTQIKTASHLGIPISSFIKALEKDAYGELPSRQTREKSNAKA